jgi:hypothetical protein
MMPIALPIVVRVSGIIQIADLGRRRSRSGSALEQRGHVGEVGEGTALGGVQVERTSVPLRWNS